MVLEIYIQLLSLPARFDNCYKRSVLLIDAVLKRSLKYHVFCLQSAERPSPIGFPLWGIWAA